MKDLGWANDWADTPREPEEYKKCCEAKHKITDIDVGPPHRGMDHVCTCDICNIRWHYDSSD